MYSVPYSHDFHSNWLGIWIHDRDDLVGDESMFTRMYYRDGFGVRQEYYYDLPELALFTPGFAASHQFLLLFFPPGLFYGLVIFKLFQVARDFAKLGLFRVVGCHTRLFQRL